MSSQYRPPFRKVALYTAKLTPRFEVPEDLRTMLDPILWDKPYEPGSYRAAFPWFFRLGEDDRDVLIDYCEELDCLHEDLEFILFDLQTAVEFSYPENPYLQRLALIYHMDNVDVRVHAYREKIFKLVDCFLGRSEHRRDAPGTNFNKQVCDALSQRHCGKVITVLNRLSREVRIKSALERRRLFVHGLARRDWALLEASHRIDEQISEPGPITDLEQQANLVALQQQRIADVDSLCELLAQFRYDLATELQKCGRR